MPPARRLRRWFVCLCLSVCVCVSVCECGGTRYQSILGLACGQPASPLSAALGGRGHIYCMFGEASGPPPAPGFGWGRDIFHYVTHPRPPRACRLGEAHLRARLRPRPTAGGGLPRVVLAVGQDAHSSFLATGRLLSSTGSLIHHRNAIL